MIPEKYQKYENTVTLACVNYQTIWGDKAANLEKMKNLFKTFSHPTPIEVLPCASTGGGTERCSCLL